MRLKLLTAIALGTLTVLAASTTSFTAANASDQRPTAGECQSPPPNPKACDQQGYGY